MKIVREVVDESSVGGDILENTYDEAGHKDLQILEEKKIGQNFMHHPSIPQCVQLTSESGRHSLAPRANPPPTPRVPNAPGSSQVSGPRGLKEKQPVREIP